ncbi:MAG: glycosyltransferase [Gammaproteobacteria bacterium]|nr:glycosyltransferase [Gammaproteobacteria bacterium]
MSVPAVSLVIPVYNEQANLTELVERCVRVCEGLKQTYEIILVDDGSSDGSRSLLRSLSQQYQGKVLAVLLNRNYGQHPAVFAGLAHARGEVVVTLDADLQNPPEEIPKLVEKIDEGYDVVGSVRIKRKDSFFRRLPSRIINAVVRKTTGVMMNDYGCMLRAYRRNVVDAVLQCTERSTFIPILANSFASKTTEVMVEHAERSGDDSKYNVWKLINLQFDLLTSMTSFPLRLLSLLGGVLAICGFAAGVLLLVMRLVYGASWAANGVLTVFAGLFVFTGVQLFGLGLVGEYLSRVYNDVRDRPRYFVSEILGGATAPEIDVKSASD